MLKFSVCVFLNILFKTVILNYSTIWLLTPTLSKKLYYNMSVLCLFQPQTPVQWPIWQPAGNREIFDPIFGIQVRAYSSRKSWHLQFHNSELYFRTRPPNLCSHRRCKSDWSVNCRNKIILLFHRTNWPGIYRRCGGQRADSVDEL